MTKSIVIVGTLDTKGDQLEYLKQQIEKQGYTTIVIDVGILGDPTFKPTIGRDAVARAAGTDIKEVIDLQNGEMAMAKMATGASKLVSKLYSDDKVNGVVGAGGSMGTSVALEVMKVLPFGLPKLIITTVANSPIMSPDMVDGDDSMILPWVAGLWGLNSMSRRVMETAAGAICGAAKLYDDKQTPRKKLVAVSSLGGSSTAYMGLLKPALEERGYEVAVYHATGMGGRILEKTIGDGLYAASLDLCAGVELLNLIADGAGSAGKHRLEAAGKMGIPQIVSLGPPVFYWEHDRPFPYKDHVHFWHSSLLLVVMADLEQMAKVGKLMAEKLNRATGPTAVVIPMKRTPRPGRPSTVSGGLMEAFRDNLLKYIRPEVKVIVLEDADLNDPLYTEVILGLFDEMMQQKY